MGLDKNKCSKTRDRDVQRKDHVKHTKTAICKPRRTTLPTLSSDLCHQHCERIDFCCINHWIWGMFKRPLADYDIGIVGFYYWCPSINLVLGAKWFSLGEVGIEIIWKTAGLLLMMDRVLNLKDQEIKMRLKWEMWRGVVFNYSWYFLPIKRA